MVVAATTLMRQDEVVYYCQLPNGDKAAQLDGIS